jgi:hypothetical protein
MPSTALSTEMAGVIMPSPYSSAAPNRPMAIIRPTRQPARSTPLVTSDMSARMPPSSWLSARITKMQYLIEMVSRIAQTTSDSSPIACAADGWPPTVPTIV